MLDVTFAVAFTAGLLSFATPCVLPLAPPYLAYLAGLGFSELQDPHRDAASSRRLIFAALAFVLGFTTVFTALGASFGGIGAAMARHYQTLSVVAGGAIILMGLHVFGALKIAPLQRERRFSPPRSATGADAASANAASAAKRLGGAYLMGLAFAFGWTPCVGPILALILFIAGDQGDPSRGAALLAVYALGIGTPFMAIAFFASRTLDFLARLRPWAGVVEKIAGAALIVAGLLIATGSMADIAEWMLRAFPSFSSVG